MPDAASSPQPTNAWPTQSKTPGRESSVEMNLAAMQEAHQKALAVATVLKGEIERLNCPLPQNLLEMRARSKSRDCQAWRAGE